jgi:casein kinase II subunit alpha
MLAINSNIILPKVYADACDLKGPEYSNYEAFKIKWGDTTPYEIVTKLGRGKYSDVYDGINVLNNRRIVIKVLKPVKKSKIKREIKILQTLRGGPNVVKLYDVVRDTPTKTPALIFEHINNVDFKKLYPSFKDFDVRYYMYEIARSLDYCHSMGIMHRDIKPQNIMIDHTQRKVRIIDWGLAEYFHPKQEYNVRVASRYYKGPELLTDDKYYSYSLDIWSLGCTFAGMMLQREPLFKGKNNYDQLVKISEVLGTDDLLEYLRKYKLTLSHHYNNILKTCPKIQWERFVNDSNRHLVSHEGLDLLSKMLVYCREDRITAKEMLQHPYFYPVHNYLKQQPGKITI